jgi:hypothetical protein
MRCLWFLIAALALAGCNGNDNPAARAAGTYPGEFRIESVDGKSDAKMIADETMKGSLELYLTQNKFKLDLASKYQGFTVEGKWTAEKSRVTLTTDKYAFQNPSEEDQKAFQLKIIQPDEIRTAFGHPLVLETSPDRRKLTGLKTSLGKLLGRLEFERPIPH